MESGKVCGFPPVPDELVQFINNNSKFIIAGHKEPDGDCVGSQLALMSALVRLGKEVIVCSAGPFKRHEIRRYAEHFIVAPAEEQKFGAKLIIVDCSDRERTGSLKDFLEGLPAAVIDHHIRETHLPSTPEAPVFMEPDAPACTLLVFELINALGLEITPQEANLLFFGLCTDTGFFRHLNEKSAVVFEAAAKMVRAGASPREIFQAVNGGKSLDSRILLGRILSRTESFFDGRLLISCETLEEFNKFGFEGRDSDSLNQLLQSVAGVKAVAIIRQESSDNCTVSFRSVDPVDVAQIAASLGGGGHRNAAGLTVKGTISYIKQKLLESFKNVFQQ